MRCSRADLAAALVRFNVNTSRPKNPGVIRPKSLRKVLSMFTRFIFTRFTGFAFIGMLTLALVAFADDETDAENQAISMLMQERRDALRDRAETLRNENRKGRVDVARVLHAENDLIDAELELARTKDERVTLHTKALENYEKIEQFAELSIKSGIGSIPEQLNAKANRIAAKIELLRERARD